MTDTRAVAGRPPRMRDLPAPRRSESVTGPLFRSAFAWPFRFGLSVLLWARVKPWQATLLSFAGNLVTGGLLLTGRRLVPGFVLLGSGILDVMDGAIARHLGRESPRGALLDSTMDRVADALVFGCLFWSLAAQGDRVGATLCLSALVVSLLVSHLRAEAEALGLSMTGGFFQRLERYVAMTIGLTVPGALLPVLALLTALGAGTAVQRFWSAWGRLPAGGASAAGKRGAEGEGRKSDRNLPPA